MNLIIGDTSQLAKYFPRQNNEFISSREINFNKPIRAYDTVYLTFAEQRTFSDLTEREFIKVNVSYTSKVIEKIRNNCKRIILYGTCELWNNYVGAIDLSMKIDYKYSPYVKSKDILLNTILEKRDKGEWNNVFIIHPFNFNSPYRREGFLFYNVFNSIINKEIINVGDLNINRDIIHPKFLVEESIKCKNDMIVGSGYLTNIKEFVFNLYEHFGLNYYEYVIEDKNHQSPHKKNEFWLNTKNKYKDLLKENINDVKQFKSKLSQRCSC